MQISLAGANLDSGDPETLLFSMEAILWTAAGGAKAVVPRIDPAQDFLNNMLPKQPRLRLDAEAYEALRLQVLRRDRWRCQFCGAMTNLEVHHQQFRSHSGADSELNLITLCKRCHGKIHRH